MDVTVFSFRRTIYLRLCERHLDCAASHIQHVQKVLTLMCLYVPRAGAGCPQHEDVLQIAQQKPEGARYAATVRGLTACSWRRRSVKKRWNKAANSAGSCWLSLSVTVETFGGDGHQLRDAGEVPVGIDHLGVPGVDREDR